MRGAMILAALLSLAMQSTFGMCSTADATRIGEAERLKQGCHDVVIRPGDDLGNAWFCVGAVTAVFEMFVLLEKHPEVGERWGICWKPSSTGLNYGDYAKLLDQKSYLMRNDDPLLIGILKVLADAFPCPASAR
jgi:hypothetical protein